MPRPKTVDSAVAEPVCDPRDIIVYSVGLCAMSVCAKEGVPVEDIERHANVEYPTGIQSRWEISDEPFANGEPNPSPCNGEDGRIHFLLNC